MDCLKIESRFIARIVEKTIERSIRKSYGVEANIRFNDIMVSFDGEEASVHVNCDAKVKKDDLSALLKNI